MADPVVTLTNGVPTAGSGVITTLGQTLLDGANLTVGAKADAKSTATDVTPITAMSVWKQISASVQSLVTNTVALGRATQGNSTPVVLASFESKTVPASATATILGATGAVGDYLEGLLCVVSTAATSQVQITDGNGTATTVLPNAVGAGVGTYYVPIGALCVNATTPGWKITTAAGVSVFATGKFT